MKISCIQMDVHLASPEENYRQAEQLIRQAAQEEPDVILLPELWDVGFFPKEKLEELADPDCTRVIGRMGPLAKELGINLVAGSVACRRADGIYNTACVFDRQGQLIAQYDKTHLFSPMGEDDYFEKGDHVCRFQMDGHDVGILICYDIRFPELTRAMTVPGLELLLMVAQWPDVRVPHLKVLTQARAIENQMFLACCNACGRAGLTRYGGNSSIVDPWGNVLAQGEESQQIVSAQCDFGVTEKIRGSMHIFADRRPELYGASCM